MATGLGIPFNDAEEIKLKYGSLITDRQDKMPTVISETQEKFSISQVDLAHILRARMEEILRMILLEIPRSDYTPSALILTGGTANMPGMEEFARQVTGLPVRVEAPKGLPETAEDLGDPMFASSVGLLLWGARHDQEEPIDLGNGLRQFYDRLRSVKLPRLPKIKLERT